MEIFEVGGDTGRECHLFITDEAAFLVDSGFFFGGAKTAENIKKILNGRKLDAVLLTHSHYDHVGGSPFVKRMFPDTVVVASEHAAHIMGKDSAREVMADMDRHAAQQSGLSTDYEMLMEKLRVDKSVQDREPFDVGGLRVTAHSAPGHTRCCMCFYIEPLHLLISCETLGTTPAYPEVIASYIIGYKITQDTIDKMRALAPKQLYISHFGLIGESEISSFFDNSAAAAKKAKDIILQGYHAGKDLDEITHDLRLGQFGSRDISSVYPSEHAFSLNTHVMVERTLKDYGLVLGHSDE